MRTIATGLLLLSMAACAERPVVPATAKVVYENGITGRSVELGEPLADQVRRTLSREPDSSTRNAGMGLDARRYIRACGRTYQVTEDRLVLLDDWGVREWNTPGIAAELDAAIGVADQAEDAPQPQ